MRPPGTPWRSLANTGNGNRTGIEIRGLTLSTSGAASNAIDVTSANTFDLGVTIENVTITAATAEGIDINHGSTSTTSTVALTNVTVTSTGNGIDINETAGTLTVTGFSDLHVTATPPGRASSSPTRRSTATRGRRRQPGRRRDDDGGRVREPGQRRRRVLTNVTGDLAFDDLDIYSGGVNGGLSVTGNGAVNAAAGTGTRVTVAAGVAAFESTGGPVVNVNNATIDLPLTSATVKSSGTTGVSLVTVSDAIDPVAAAAFSAAGGSIASTAGVAFNVAGSNAAISYPGAITKATDGRLIDFFNYDTDTATLSGNLSCTARATASR